MGVVFQSFGLLPTLSAVENVELPLRVNGSPLDDARERASGWLERLGLTDRMHNRTFELSAGQQQRVAVARALITEPEVVLADEPIAEVDTENADLILAALWDVIGRGGAVLAATHNPEALRYANRVVLFRDGVIEAEGSPERARRPPHHRLVWAWTTVRGQKRRDFQTSSPRSTIESGSTSTCSGRSPGSRRSTRSSSVRRPRARATAEPMRSRRVSRMRRCRSRSQVG